MARDKTSSSLSSNGSLVLRGQYLSAVDVRGCVLSHGQPPCAIPARNTTAFKQRGTAGRLALTMRQVNKLNNPLQHTDNECLLVLKPGEISSAVLTPQTGYFFSCMPLCSEPVSIYAQMLVAVIMEITYRDKIID